VEAVILENIEKVYAGTAACTGVSLAVEESELFTLLGPSGCGKTTILRLIAGFIQPDKGKIFFGEREITRLAPEKRQVGMVFQNYALFPFMTVAENIAYGLKVQKSSRVKQAEKVAKYIEMVGLAGFERRKVADLSGGEQQRVALARSLAVEPKVLLLDEPLSNLDARLRDRMRTEIRSLQKRLGITTIFVTHDQIEALTMSDRIAVFNQGRCIQVGTPEDIYSKPASSFVAGFIGESNLFPAKIDQDVALISAGVAIRLATPTSGRFVSIRPQDISFIDGADSTVNLFTGKVESRQCTGIAIEYRVRVEEIGFRVTVLNTATRPAEHGIGDVVQIAIARECVTVLGE
jgi:iron(III) transport system ATP-binding protein